MMLNTTTIVVLLANGMSAVIAAALMMLVLWQAPRHRMNQVFAIAMLMQFAYSVANGFGRFIDDLNFDPRHATYIAISFYGMYVTAVFFFASEFAETRPPSITVMRWGGVFLGAVVTVAMWNDILISDIYPAKQHDGSYGADWTPAGMVVVGMIVLYLLSAMIVLYRLPDERGRSLWGGPLFLLLGNVSNFVLWPLFHLPLQSVFLAAGALVMGRPVLQYELFNPLAQAHLELGEKNTKLRQAYQMKNQFLTNVSHELRTPLNSIIGYTELVLSGTYGALNDTQTDRLQKVVRNGRNLLGLINDVLDLSRMETGRVALERQMVDTPRLLDTVLDVIAPLAAQKGLTVIRDYANAPPVYADELRLRQIITNIAANAVKFTHEGGVTIRARTVTDGVRFEISDTGIGIPPDEFNRVFMEFEQIDSSTTRRYEGTGLGMAITKRLVEMHGGRIWLESEQDLGTTFYVTIPASAPFEFDGPAQQLNAPAGHATVLVIDDSAEARLLLSDTLGNAGYAVVTANNGLTGVTRAKELQPDLITLDVMMPGMDGWQVLRALKEDDRTRTIPVVIVSIVDNRPLALSLGAKDAVAKPLDRNALLHALRQTLDTSRVGLPDGIADIAPVLVVDDREDDRALIVDILNDQGYPTASAEDGRTALNWLADHQPSVVLLDLMMPDLSGFDVLAAMRQDERLSQTPVIVLTAKELTASERAFLQTRTADLIAKDNDSNDALLTLVAQACQPARQPVPPV